MLRDNCVCTWPAIANHRLKVNSSGQVVYELKIPYRNGTTHVVFSPKEFMPRLAALVPRPCLNLIRFYGVLAPYAKLRLQINASPPTTTIPEDHSQQFMPSHPHRMNWAWLLKQVFNIDITSCPDCGGNMKIIVAIEDPEAIKKILNHLGLSAQPPPRTSVRYANTLLETA